MGDVEKFILGAFKYNKHPDLIYHDLEHTPKVVPRVREICGHYLLDEKDLFVVLCAAWFHDLGYLSLNEPDGHELRGAELAESFLKKYHISDDILAKIRGCILVTT